MTQPAPPSLLGRIFKSLAAVEPFELKAVTLSLLYGFFLFGSYSVIKPVRDTMGTVYGVTHYNELFTMTFLGTLVLSPLYSGLAARVKLSSFLPWVYGFIAVTIFGFFLAFSGGKTDNRTLAASFYVWVSVFNLLIISVFWSFMSDLFSRTQAKRLYGLIAAGITVGGIVGPLVATVLAKQVGNSGLMLISAVGFIFTAFLVTLLAREKQRLATAAGVETQHTTLDRKLGGSPIDGFKLLLKSPYLLLLALFLFLMTWISTIVYQELGDLLSKHFPSKEARTQAYATIDLAVNWCSVFLQLVGTGRIINRFGVKVGLLLNPIIMVLAFLAIAFSPALLVLGGLQVARRVAEYALAKPAREMLFTVVDQESKYKAKNVIDTVVYRGGDVCAAWAATPVLANFGATGLAILGVVVSLIWFPVAWTLGKRYESARAEVPGASEVSPGH